MLQTGHGGYGSVPNTVAKVITERDRQPAMPVVVGEVNYEGILHGTQAETQRLTYWSAVLSGAAGFTYGANGLWQVNRREEPYGTSPHGASWGDMPWDEAVELEGSRQLGLAKSLLTEYDWWRFEPHPEWVEPAGSAENVAAPFAAGIPRKVRVIYLYQPLMPWTHAKVCVRGLERDLSYRAFYWNPRNGVRRDIGVVDSDDAGAWPIPIQPTMSDWVLVLEALEYGDQTRPVGRVGEITVRPVPVDMGPIVQEVARRLSDLIHAQGAEMVVPTHWPQALGHRPWIEEAWTMHISKAIRDGGPAPRVQVGAAPVAGGKICFWVRCAGNTYSFELPAALMT
jgi:hypothetical protein